MRRRLAVSLLTLFACGGSLEVTPEVSISAPQPQSSVVLGTDPDESIVVSFSVTNFTLSKSCGPQAGCGIVHVVIDDYGSPCNSIAGTGFERYNAEALATPTAAAHFVACGSGAAGPHTIKLQLVDGAGNDVVDATGNVVSANVAVQVTKH